MIMDGNKVNHMSDDPGRYVIHVKYGEKSLTDCMKQVIRRLLLKSMDPAPCRGKTEDR